MKPLPLWSIDPDDRASEAPALGDIVAATASRWPERDAVSDGRSVYTFAQLEEGARALAAWLSEQGVGPSDRVVVLAEKRAIMPMVAIAIWKRGAVYVPCDATQPPARLRALLDRLEPRAVIALDDRDPLAPGPAWLGGGQVEIIAARPAPSPATERHGADEPAYIIFTSGSTGQPKGVEVSAGSLVAYFTNHNHVLRFTPRSRVFSLSPFHFDVSIEDTVLPLSLGSFVYQFRNVHAGPIMRAVLARERITHLIAVSTLLTIITGDGREITQEKLPAMEMVMTGAEVCDPGVINIWKRNMPEARVFNVYGPTEATIVCVAHEIEEPDTERRAAYPIGRPLRGVEAKIMNRDAEVHQPGVIGELWIGGEQVMRGYFDQPEETARLVVELDGVRYYRTGDLCSYDADGSLVFEGRADDEVKLFGRRVHLGEIRQTALSCPGVERAAVALVRRAQRDVVALVVMCEAARVVPDVEEHLANLLPDYMRPTLIGWSPVSVSATGKTDEKRLIDRLRKAAQSASADYFSLSDQGSFEPMEMEAHA